MGRPVLSIADSVLLCCYKNTKQRQKNCFLPGFVLRTCAYIGNLLVPCFMCVCVKRAIQALLESCLLTVYDNPLGSISSVDRAGNVVTAVACESINTAKC